MREKHLAVAPCSITPSTSSSCDALSFPIPVYGYYIYGFIHTCTTESTETANSKTSNKARLIYLYGCIEHKDIYL